MTTPTLTSPDNVRSISDMGKDQRGRFTSSPNNIGRPKGAVNRVTRELLATVKDLGPIAILKLTEAVTNGDKWALEYVLNRILPQSRTIEFENIDADNVKQALCDGTITTGEAKELSATLAKLSEITDLKTLRLRMEELEKLLIAQSG